MIDRLDKQILEIIINAPSLVRSVTQQELKAGVLYPSVTTMDIKRNLPSDYTVDIIEGRLRALESEGYIYFESDRWWITTRGRSALGSTLPAAPHQPSPKPMRDILEETFSKFDFSNQSSSNELPQGQPGSTRQLAESIILLLQKGYEQGLVSQDDLVSLVEKLTEKLENLDPSYHSRP
jgi:hypothetical protein